MDSKRRTANSRRPPGRGKARRRHNVNPLRRRSSPAGPRKQPPKPRKQSRQSLRQPARAKTEHLQTHRRGKAINRSVASVAGIFFVFVLVYLLRSLYVFAVTPHTATEVVKMGSIDLPQEVEGIIIRDEDVYYADREGRVMYNVGDYDRVKTGTSVCSIQNVQAVEDINKSMATIEEQIIALQEMRQDISSVDPAVQRVNAQIKNMIDNKLYHLITHNISEMYAMKESISQNVNIRNQMIIDENQYIKEELSLQQQQLLTRLDSNYAAITVERGGILSPVVDGLEEALNFDNVNELTKEQTQMKVDFNEIIPLKDVQPGDPVFKIVTSNIWRIAAYMPNELIEGYEEGDLRTIYIENGGDYTPMVMHVERIDGGYRESYVVFKCTKNIIDYLNMRSVKIKTSDSVRKGLKISNSAIVTRTFFVIPLDYVYESDENRHVIKQTAEGEVIVPVIVADQDEEYAYILDDVVNLYLGDTLLRLTYPDYVLGETMTVQGVYRVNNGYAEFRKVILDTEIPSTSGYSILNPSLKQGVKAYDYIVTDASGIEDGQIVK